MRHSSTDKPSQARLNLVDRPVWLELDLQESRYFLIFLSITHIGHLTQAIFIISGEKIPIQFVGGAFMVIDLLCFFRPKGWWLSFKKSFKQKKTKSIY